MREALAKGKFIMFKTDGDSNSQETLEATVDYPLALFLIVAETSLVGRRPIDRTAIPIQSQPTAGAWIRFICKRVDLQSKRPPLCDILVQAARVIAAVLVAC